MFSCGLGNKHHCIPESKAPGKKKAVAVSASPRSSSSSGGSSSSSSYSSDCHSQCSLISPPPPHQSPRKQEFLQEFQWARHDQLSTILESLEGSRRNTPDPTRLISEKSTTPKSSTPKPHPRSIPPKSIVKTTRFELTENVRKPSSAAQKMSERRSSSVSPKMIRPPPRDLESISRIDASLVFEHFTTSDAWELGSSLRSRLLPIPTPVVINISLANQKQTIFHSVTHSGVMPDNELWVERKRNTVLRWGCSTWFMACKFGGDEVAFREKYGLGNSAGNYAIHGGGVPIRVTGVEGVVAVVVVSGLKQDEDHAVIVEVIKDLYY